MSLLKSLNIILNTLEISAETGVFSKEPPDEYVVLTPLQDRLTFFADNEPMYEVNEVRMSLFTKSNYIQRKKQITKLLMASGITITDRQYIGYENDTKYHHYVIDVLKEYEMEEE